MIQFKVKQESITMTLNSRKPLNLQVEKAVTVGVSSRTYEGPYEVIPSVEGSTIETKEKYMKDDVTVHPIQFFTVSNNSGGNTVFIGSEVLTNGDF